MVSAHLSDGSVKSGLVLLHGPSFTNTRRCSDSKKDLTDIVLELSILEMLRELSDSLKLNTKAPGYSIGIKRAQQIIFTDIYLFFRRSVSRPLSETEITQNKIKHEINTKCPLLFPLKPCQTICCPLELTIFCPFHPLGRYNVHFVVGKPLGDGEKLHLIL